jgi:hypothetical protein
VERILKVIVNPNRYRSKAAEAFSQDILPQFASGSMLGTVKPASGNSSPALVDAAAEKS